MLGRLPRLAPRLVVATVALCLLSPVAAQAAPVEDYASYKPQNTCTRAAKPGTVALGHWLVKHFGGGFGPTWRRCAGSSTSEHKDGRAFDWTLDAVRPGDRNRASRFLARAFATDAAGNEHATARRMGIMYLIWNDHMYAAHDHFAKRVYLSSSCKSRKKCSKTLRHRDHLHISLSRPGGAGRTSWYDGRVPSS